MYESPIMGHGKQGRVLYIMTTQDLKNVDEPSKSGGVLTTFWDRCIGIGREPCSHSEASNFENNSNTIVNSLLMLAEFKTHPCFTTGFDSVHAWRELFKISEFL
jgi:hypothetical protein